MTDAAPSHGAGYEVRLQQVAIAGAADFQIRSLLDRQQYSDPDGAAEREGISAATWSLFGQVWPSAVVLADLMQTWDLRATRVLEIGCGLALASLVVHRRHGDVTASDNHPLAETFLRDNLRRNELPPMKYRQGNWTRDEAALGVFDLIIGSDVLYERDHPAQLAGFVDRHAAEHAVILIIDPDRGNRPGFTRRLGQEGFALTETKLCRSPDGSGYRGRVLQYRR